MTQKEFKEQIQPLISAAKNIGALFINDRVSIDTEPECITIRVNDFEYQERKSFFCYGGTRFEEEESNDTV